MAALQTVAFGAASDGSQGDAVRTAFTKQNSNVAVLQTQAALVSNSSTITTAQALTVAHVGKRVNINLATAGTINVPSAATCAADNVLLLRNVGTTVVTLAITTGSGDTCALSKLNPGESAILDTDGVHAWAVLMRGRANLDNEVVNGNCTVGGNETVGGTLTVTGAITASGGFSARPSFNGNTPWDSGNLNPNAIPGVTTGTAPGAGVIGELQSVTTTTGSVNSGVTSNVSLLSLPAGVWDVQGVVHVNSTAVATVTGAYATVNTASATLGDLTNTAQWSGSSVGANRLVTPVKRLVLSATTTVYLVTNVTCSGPVAVPGLITARRVA